MNRRLIHYSDTPLVVVHSTEQVGEKYDWHGGRKPAGLWVSAEGDDDWRVWCEGERFRSITDQFSCEIVLRPDHAVLLVDTADAMTLFHREFGVKSGQREWKEWRIDWPRVAKRYGGIIIAPYQWSHRLDGELSGWYYSWDCASGCIWDASSVAEIKLISAPEAAGATEVVP